MITKLSVCFIDIDSARKKSCNSNLSTTLFDETVDKNIAHIVCAHANDLNGKNPDKSKTKYGEANPDKLIIIYSGGGCDRISQGDLESKRVLMIERAVFDSKSAITKDEWIKVYELIDWETKTFIRSKLGYDYILPALSILCQGYLATHNNKKKVSPDIEDALVIIKNTTKASSRRIDKNITDDLSWWHNCFDGEDIIVKQSTANIQQSSQNEQLSTSKVMGKITHEWESNSLNNSKLAELLRAIYSYGTISTQTVAEAYLDIIKHSHH